MMPLPNPLQGECQRFRSEFLAVDRARMGLHIHHSKLPSKAVLVMMQLASKVSRLPSEVL